SAQIGRSESAETSTVRSPCVLQTGRVHHYIIEGRAWYHTVPIPRLLPTSRGSRRSRCLATTTSLRFAKCNSETSIYSSAMLCLTHRNLDDHDTHNLHIHRHLRISPADAVDPAFFLHIHFSATPYVAHPSCTYRGARYTLGDVARSALPSFLHKAPEKLHKPLAPHPPTAKTEKHSNLTTCHTPYHVCSSPPVATSITPVGTLLIQRHEEARFGPLAVPIATEDPLKEETATEDAITLLGLNMHYLVLQGQRIVLTVLTGADEVALGNCSGDLHARGRCSLPA
ncbi:hypothetical protein V8E53_003051, partial [Lactarius tabidus]